MKVAGRLTATWCLLLALALAGPAAAQAPGHRVTFDYHSAFLMNLHHFLYDMAVHPDKLARVDWAVAPDENGTRTLGRAIAFYHVYYGSLSLREDPALYHIKRALSVDDARRDVVGLPIPPALADVLRAAAPVYAASVWPRIDASNRRWIAGARARDAAYGAQIQAALEQHFAARFPAAPIRVDVVFDTGSRQGAYTDEQTVMPSGRADYQDAAALEMLYHEASHTSVTGPLEAMIGARLKATGRPADSELWHVVQFYTVGAVTRDVLARHGQPGYVPYAGRRGLFTGPWVGFMPAIEASWRDHMDDRTDLPQAVRNMVDRLPAN
jgi:hypothetical protein